MGDRLETCRKAVDRIGRIPDTHLRRTSSWYETEPLGPPDQPWFINAVAEIETGLSPAPLLDALLRIEQEFGRVRRARWGPRILDLDLLVFGDAVIRTPGLVLPHPQVHHRRFVLVPLHELAPTLRHPLVGRTVADLLSALEGGGVVQRVESAHGA